MSSEEASKTILEGIELDPEQYRLGHTKVYNTIFGTDFEY